MDHMHAIAEGRPASCAPNLTKLLLAGQQWCLCRAPLLATLTNRCLAILEDWLRPTWAITDPAPAPTIAQ